MSPTAEALEGIPHPEVVLLSKRDIYDSHGVVAKFTSGVGYRRTARLPAFEVFERLPPPRP
jgi:hypothetical protein